MNKKQILEQLNKQDYLQGVKSSELEFFRQLFGKIREYDYEGFVQSARQNGLDLGPVFTVLEAQATERLPALLRALPTGDDVSGSGAKPGNGWTEYYSAS